MGQLSEVQKQILGKLNIEDAYRKLGVEFVSRKPSRSNRLACHAVRKDGSRDTNPSAWISLTTGRYGDSASPEKRGESLFDFTARVQGLRDYIDGMEYWAREVGVDFKRNGHTPRKKRSTAATESPTNAADKSQQPTHEHDPPLALDDLTPRNDKLIPFYLGSWLPTKPGVTIEAIQKTKWRIAEWRNRSNVIAFNCYRPDDWENPKGIKLFQTHGFIYDDVGRSCRNLNGSRDAAMPVGSKEEWDAAHTILFCEGETDALAAAGSSALPAGWFVVGLMNGAGSLTETVAGFAAGKRAVVCGDADKPGIDGAWAGARNCLKVSNDVRFHPLPYDIADKHGKDLRDLMNEGGFPAWLAQVQAMPPLTESDLPAVRMEAEKANGLPTVMLPCEGSTITRAAEELGRLLAAAGRFYTRDGLPMRAAYSDGEVRLEELRPAAACSDFETVASLVKERNGKKETFIVPAVCSVSTAKQILESQPLRSRLPKITVMSRCPVLIEREGSLIVIKGYDAESGIWAMGDDPPEIGLDESRMLLESVLSDFNFASHGDKSRALAALLTPAMVFGGLLAGRAPIDVGEADESQAGKGFRNKLTAAIYRNTPRAITQRERGVGSLQETFDMALISGACFPALDNLRGRFETAAIESFMTEPDYYARVPYSSPVKIDAQKTIVMLTTNKAELTLDMANRSSVVRICKRDDSFPYKKFPEGDILAHVKANHQKFLGAVFAVVREWHRQGKPMLSSAMHDFQAWSKSLGWIVEHLLHNAPLMAEHRDIQARVATPAKNWLRDLAMAVRTSGKLGQELRAHHLLDIGIDAQIEMPGVGPDFDHEDEKKFNAAVQAVGRKLSKLMTGESMTIDSVFRVDRETRQDGSYREIKIYRFSLENQQETQEARYTPYGPAIDPAIETNDPAIPAMESKTLCAHAHMHAHAKSPDFVPIAGIAGLSGVLNGSACDHVNPANWVSRGNGRYCSACNRWMGGSH